MNDTLPMVYRDFRDHTCERYFLALLPLYRVRLVLSVLERQSLSIFAQFILRAIGLEIDTPSDIARALGLDEDILTEFAVELLRADMITQSAPDAGGKRRLALTALGRERAADGIISVPRRRHEEFHLDTVTGALGVVDSSAINVDEAMRRGTYILPSVISKPTAETNELQAIRDAMAIGGSSKQNLDVLTLLTLSRAYPQYLPDVEVFELRPRYSGETVLAAYRHGHYVQNISLALQAMRDAGRPIIPDDAYTFNVAVPDIQGMVSASVADEARTFAERARAILASERARDALAIVQATVLGEERRVIEQRMGHIDQDITARRRERDETLGRLAILDPLPTSVVGSAFIDTLVAAIKRTKDGDEIVLVAPRMSRDVVDGQLGEALGNAVRRSVRVHIGYDFEEESGDGDGARLRRNALSLKKALEKWAEWAEDVPSENLSITDVRGVTATICVCGPSPGMIADGDLLYYNATLTGAYKPAAALAFHDRATVAALAREAKVMLSDGRS